MIVCKTQKSLFCSSNSCIFFSSSSSSSSSPRCYPVMLQYKTFQNYTGSCFPCSPFGCCEKYRKCSQLRFNKVREFSMITCSQLNVLRLNVPQEFHRFRTRSGFKHAITVSSQLGVGFLNPVIPANVFSHGILDGGCLRYHESSTKRFFSQVKEVVNKNNHVGLRGGKDAGNASSPKLFTKNQNWAAPLAAHRKGFDGGTDPNFRTSCQKDGNAVTLADQHFGGSHKDVKLGPSVSTSTVNYKSEYFKNKGNKGQQSRIKKKKEKLSAATSSSAVQTKRSERVSQSKRPNKTKNVKLSETSENDSAGSAPTEEGDSSVSTMQQSKKTTKSSIRKGKSLKEGSSVKKYNEGLRKPSKSARQPSSSNYLPQKERSHIIDKTQPEAQKTPKQLYPPTARSVLVVESITKAKVIQGYLGDMYEVLPSYGHIRDLAARSGSVRPDDDFSMVWEVPSAAWTHLKSINVALSRAENLILASDPDREGEAIAWHIIEMLQQQDALHEDVNVARVVFHEITESSVKAALQAPRNIDQNLVHAYLVRRALDYLIGFNISPLLWRKLPGCQSAGRVQSAALSIICDREMEIDEFKSQEYWSVEAEFKKKEENTLSLPAFLNCFDLTKLNQLSISSHAEAMDIEKKIKSSNLIVLNSKRNKMRKNPPAPYITSTLQQDAANKLHFTASYTMKLAQGLYEGVQLSDGKATGLITYIRTDGLHVSNEAAKEVCSLVIERYGQDFTSEDVRKYFKKVKNAQEAHEAIRPTDIRCLPSMLIGILDEDALKLYTLIWSRMMSCQMKPASIDQVQLNIGTADESITFRSACSRVEFRGYQAVYEDVESGVIRPKEKEGNDGDAAFEVLQSFKTGDPLYLAKVELKQHHTQPPARYSEASLVKKLEELGIGRPSTYASTLKVLRDRNYVIEKNRVLHPEFRGRMVSAFLSHHFSEVTNYSFTADMETELDNVSAGLTEWKGLLKDYWTRFSFYCEHASSVHIHQVEKMLEKKFGDFLFSSLLNGSRTCPSCMDGTLIFKVSRFGEGYFIGCDQHPKCKYIARTFFGDDDEDVPPQNNSVEEPKMIGLHPGTSEKILLKNGPYGFYVQLGEDKKGYVPKRASVSQMKDVDSITLEDALELLRYPVTLGNHPEDNQPVVLKLAKNGFSIRHRHAIAPVPKNLKPNDITMEKALELLLSKDVRRFGRPKQKHKPKHEEVVEAM
ncbi:uncharacterized protein LOC131151636 [Malania oleifera]|uniref:uncharacterized protein LOC131151636 n=1 Tax=Malania oleifera TaxID=397392 RepID=UPI0025AE05E2|nr:uncharacterized protein LOC131151636 [Malania oleifera]